MLAPAPPEKMQDLTQRYLVSGPGCVSFGLAACQAVPATFSTAPTGLRRSRRPRVPDAELIEERPEDEPGRGGKGAFAAQALPRVAVEMAARGRDIEGGQPV